MLPVGGLFVSNGLGYHPVAMIDKKIGFLRTVGIGASAGGLDALSQLLPLLKPDAHSVYIIAQHMAKDNHIDLVLRLLKRHSVLPITVAIHNGLLVADQVFLLPPGVTGVVQQGRIQLLPVTSEQISSPSVNALFNSIAQSAGGHGIGVVLSGAGSDGLSGCRAIKAAGGKIIVQNLESCQLAGMPGAVIGAQLPDEILLPEQIAESLNYQNRLPQPLPQPPRPQKVNPAWTDITAAVDDADIFRQLFQSILALTKCDFSSYKEETLVRRLHRRMMTLNITSVRDYQIYTQKNPDELRKLQHQFLISLSFFFRDSESFAVLQLHLVELLKGKARGDSIRIWVPGCASGEECYSWAMLLEDILGSQLSDYRICIIGSDLNEQAIAIAEQGVYSQAAFREISPDNLSHCFDHNGQEFTVKPHLRAICQFHVEDVVSCQLLEKVDAISCRNLLIYMKGDLQDRLIGHFRDFLHPGGLLFLGQSETIGLIGNTLFSPLDHFHRVYRRKKS